MSNLQEQVHPLTVFANKLKAEDQALMSYFGHDKNKVSKFKRTVVDYVNKNPHIVQGVDPKSIIESCKTIAMFDLTLGGDVDIIKRGDKVAAEMQYKGFITLLSRSNIPAKANAVYVNDTFSINLATGEISHSPAEGDRGVLKGVYAMIKIAGEWIIDYMSSAEIEAFKKKYVKTDKKGQYSQAWRFSLPEMGKKTILKRLSKPYLYGKNNEVLNEMIKIDNNTETNDGETLKITPEKPEILKFIEDEAQTIEALETIDFDQIPDKYKTDAKIAYDKKVQEILAKEPKLEDIE